MGEGHGGPDVEAEGEAEVEIFIILRTDWGNGGRERWWQNEWLSRAGTVWADGESTNTTLLFFS